jgi:hypothetical protein
VKHGAGGASTSGEGPGAGGARAGKDQAGWGARAERIGRGKLDGCIMHQVHTSVK